MKLADPDVKRNLKCPENIVRQMVVSGINKDFIAQLTLGIAGPLREAIRMCQMTPPTDWPQDAYKAISRDDVAHLYRSAKEYLVTKAATSGESETTTGVEYEFAKELSSSTICSGTEHDQAKDHQMQAPHIAERTLALPHGSAMFTFGSMSFISREAFSIPKFEFAVKLHPSNSVVTLEELVQDSVYWGQFHNSVAAALGISSSAASVDSSSIAFHKPSELTPDHAGFLFRPGLTGHLKEMLTWRFSAANVGNGNPHVTKLLAVHMLALLPTPTVDLNVPLHTQAVGMTGVGLLYIGTKNRRMAIQREAYTYSPLVALGMVMSGKGTSIPADTTLVECLNILIHGDRGLGGPNTSFDINLTLPAASIALVNVRDVADLLSVPPTILSLNCVQPSFRLIRTFARLLIRWSEITPANEWMVNDRRLWRIIAGCSFAIGLKFAGTGRQEVYKMIIQIRLNLITISLSMVMVGTGEITCLRRGRYVYGMYVNIMYYPAFKYRIHVSIHQALGGRFTLGTSDAAIAAAFFPSHFNSSDNKCYLQALRHFWVLSVNPRHLISIKEGRVVGHTQLVALTPIPDLNNLMSVRVDTPGYWPFCLDTEKIPQQSGGAYAEPNVSPLIFSVNC
ncbi:hypothetical protein DFJ43DRAFT_1179954 [Lentinula guzmanii]|uniref:Anaphase-promoting complex subunit 1 n=1 Tax=Lentinula guzmanii TaxID=2804957 RepID=A0AA38JLZ7_9AGAR|nr:hypothetical protein DFJ43DRAFT_1179954 [Lentinula guzmanii]